MQNHAISLKLNETGLDIAQWIQPQRTDRTALMKFQFGEYTLDLAQGCLRTAGRAVDLRPKSFEVLRCLVENAGRLVTKDELIKAVWPTLS